MNDERRVAAHLWEYAEDQDRFRGAADQLEMYLREILSEAGIDYLIVNSRAKSLRSYRVKSEKLDRDGLPKYFDPTTQITDVVAARIIVFTTQARARAVDLLQRISVLDGESPKNPGEDKHNGYDSDHLVVESFRDEDLQRRAPDLSWFFSARPGLELQVRTVAGHAWAEYEHDVRYKTPGSTGTETSTSGYDALDSNSRARIDQLFVEAGGLRKYLDDTFDAIETVLRPDHFEAAQDGYAVTPAEEDFPIEDVQADAPLSEETLVPVLSSRYPGAEAGAAKSRNELLQHLEGLRITSTVDLNAALQDIDSDAVAALMPHESQPTAVRRLEDDLLARFGEALLNALPGEQEDRRVLLEGRLRRLQGKLLIYTVEGDERLEGKFLTAARTFREIVRLVAISTGDVGAATLDGLVATTNNFDAGARARAISTPHGQLWLNTNLTRSVAESGIRSLVERLPGSGIVVRRAGDLLTEAPGAA